MVTPHPGERRLGDRSKAKGSSLIRLRKTVVFERLLARLAEAAKLERRNLDIELLLDGPLPAGPQNLTWQAQYTNGHELPRGVYLLRLRGRHSDGSEAGATHQLTLLR